MKRVLFALALAAALGYGGPACAGDKPLVMDVWPGPAPGETGKVGEEKMEESGKVKRVSNVTQPTLTVFRPARIRIPERRSSSRRAAATPSSPGTWKGRRSPTGSTRSA